MFSHLLSEQHKPSHCQLFWSVGVYCQTPVQTPSFRLSTGLTETTGSFRPYFTSVTHTHTHSSHTSSSRSDSWTLGLQVSCHGSCCSCSDEGVFSAERSEVTQRAAVTVKIIRTASGFTAFFCSFQFQLVSTLLPCSLNLIFFLFNLFILLAVL